jgi:salicylate hydroxylase
MGGLASALALAKNGFKNIHVYETASNLGFVGAGIQLAPNMARILDKMDCWSEIEKEGTDVRETSIRRKTILLKLCVLGIDSAQRAQQTRNSHMWI